MMGDGYKKADGRQQLKLSLDAQASATAGLLAWAVAFDATGSKASELG